MRPKPYCPRNGAGTGVYGLIRCFDEKLPVRKGKRRKAVLWGHIRNRIGSGGWGQNTRMKTTLRSQIKSSMDLSLDRWRQYLQSEFD